MNERPNVLLILTDQMRRDSLGCHGGPAVTPNLDALAKEGVSFRNAYCVYPMCTPARAALLTGRFPHALRMEGGDSPYYENNQLLDTGEVTYAKELQKAGGYRCAYIGKWHNDCQDGGKMVPRGPRRQGFDHFWRGVETGASHVSPEYFDDENRPLSFEGAWDPDVQAGMACDFLSRQDGEASPFCLVVSISPPHDPWDLPGGRSSLLAEASSRIGPASLRPNVPARLQDQALEDYVRYHANILGVDDCVGRILEALRKTGHETDTIVLFTSDHGDSLHSHGLRQKNQFHEEASAVPLILRWPGRARAGMTTGAFWNHVDLAPTILGLCGVPIPRRMQGKSHAPLLLGKGDGLQAPNDSAYLEIYHPWWDFRFGQGPQGHRRCLVTDEWKLVLLESRGGEGSVVPCQLFDRQADPFEMNNLARCPGHQPVVCDLTRRMWRWMAETDDPFFDLTVRGMPADEIQKLRRQVMDG